jgi:hypothetical protein
MPRIQFQESPTIVRPRRGSPEVPDSPEDRRHAEEADRIETELRTFGITPGKVAPTRDRQGHVRLNFEQIRQLLGM